MTLSNKGEAQALMTADRVGRMLDIVGVAYENEPMTDSIREQLRQAAEHYFELLIVKAKTRYGFSFNTAQAACHTLVFFDAYLAGLRNIKQPKPSW